MNKRTGRILAIIGLSLQAVVLVGVVIMLAGIFSTFESMDAAKDTADAASRITGGVWMRLNASMCR